MWIRPAIFIENENAHQVFNENSNDLIHKIQGDILYLDPPYNAENTEQITIFWIPLQDMITHVIPKKSKLRDYQKSNLHFCKKNQVSKPLKI